MCLKVTPWMQTKQLQRNLFCSQCAYMQLCYYKFSLMKSALFPVTQCHQLKEATHVKGQQQCFSSLAHPPTFSGKGSRNSLHFFFSSLPAHKVCLNIPLLAAYPGQRSVMTLRPLGRYIPSMGSCLPLPWPPLSWSGLEHLPGKMACKYSYQTLK